MGGVDGEGLGKGREQRIVGAGGKQVYGDSAEFLPGRMIAGLAARGPGEKLVTVTDPQ